MTQTPDMAAILDSAMSRRLKGVYTCQVGSVIRYDATTQQVDVQPVVMGAYEAENGDRVAETLPPLNGIPVAFPTGGGYRLTLPIAVGDFVVVVHTHSSHDQWLVGEGGVVDPRDDRRHHLSDAVAFPAVRPFGNALQSAPTSYLSLGADSGPVVEVDKDTSEVRVGGHDGCLPVLMHDPFFANFTSFLSSLQVLVAALVAADTAGVAFANTSAAITPSTPSSWNQLSGGAATWSSALTVALASAVGTFNVALGNLSLQMSQWFTTIAKAK